MIIYQHLNHFNMIIIVLILHELHLFIMDIFTYPSNKYIYFIITILINKELQGKFYFKNRFFIKNLFYNNIFLFILILKYLLNIY